jgi:pimeloyl-ACP methyl ester carboxylesterase
MKTFGKVVLALAVIVALGYGYWRYDHTDRESRAATEALAALQSDTDVTVSTDNWIVFRPADSTPSKGLIFYPGGEVDERGYAEPLRAIADAGYLVVLVPMPLQLAVFAPDRATEVIDAFPEIGIWAVGGHSLGGSIAARYAHHHPEKLAGLIMWDAFAADDMNESSLKVILIHRSTEDKQPPPDYTDKLPLLPAQTEYVPIEGGTHLNFGRFIAGRLFRDAPPAELDPERQMAMAADASIAFMNAL